MGVYYQSGNEMEVLQPITKTIIVDEVQADLKLDNQSVHFWESICKIESESITGEITELVRSIHNKPPVGYILEIVTSTIHLPFLFWLSNRPPPFLQALA